MKGSIARAEEIIASDPGSWMPQQFENPANRRSPSPHDGAGNPARLRRQSAGRDHHRRRHRRPHHRLRRGAEAAVAEPEGLRGRADAFAGPLRRQAGPAPIQGIGAGFIPAIMDAESARRRDPGRSRATPRRWRAAPPARKACWSASRRARRSRRSTRSCPSSATAAHARLQLRHRRALSVGPRLPARRGLSAR